MATMPPEGRLVEYHRMLDKPASAATRRGRAVHPARHEPNEKGITDDKGENQVRLPDSRCIAVRGGIFACQGDAPRHGWQEALHHDGGASAH